MCVQGCGGRGRRSRWTRLSERAEFVRPAQGSARGGWRQGPAWAEQPYPGKAVPLRPPQRAGGLGVSLRAGLSSSAGFPAVFLSGPQPTGAPAAVWGVCLAGWLWQLQGSGFREVPVLGHTVQDPTVSRGPPGLLLKVRLPSPSRCFLQDLLMGARAAKPEDPCSKPVVSFFPLR